MVNMSSVYLGGPIRNSKEAFEYDCRWRQHFTAQASDLLCGHKEIILNPIASIKLDGDRWLELGAKCSHKYENSSVFHRDVACIKKSDILFMNLLPFTSGDFAFNFGPVIGAGTVPAEQNGYPCIGSLSEVGMGLITNKIVIIVATDKMLLNHPFINAATRVFASYFEAFDFTLGTMAALGGYCNHLANTVMLPELAPKKWPPYVSEPS